MTPSARTVALFRALQREVKDGGNDQWSMDRLLNVRDVVLVGVLPRGFKRRGLTLS